MDYITPTKYVVNISTEIKQPFYFLNIENQVDALLKDISDSSCAEQQRKELLRALNTLVLAVTSEDNSLEKQKDLYLKTVAIPRAMEAITKYGK